MNIRTKNSLTAFNLINSINLCNFKNIIMALINCPECGKEVSNRAVSCPNCGLPLQNNPQTESSNKQELGITEKDPNIIPCPEFPSDLNIGQQITNWSFNS